MAMKEIQLGEVKEGELFLWKHKVLGDVYAEVLSSRGIDQNDFYVTVMADNNVRYRWTAALVVWVDR